MVSYACICNLNIFSRYVKLSTIDDRIFSNDSIIATHGMVLMDTQWLSR